MNPATAAQPMPRPMVNDIAGPAPPAPMAAAPSATMTTNLVTNIPVHAPQAASSANEDAELDKIMRVVGQELKKEVQPKKSGRFSLFSRKDKPVPATTIPAKPLPAVAAQTVAPAQPAAPVRPQPAATPAISAAKPKPAPSAPVMVITMTIIVTGLLMAAAIYTYK